ncbi:MAG TPA: endolytic transglycosylase MltG [Micrococcaceae bacterium]|nr:endolytic transglycosylase MltG [Micrococcaceae bacterium]
MSHNSTDRPTTRRARRSQDRLLEQERQAQEQGRYNDDGHYYAPLHAGEQPDAHGDDSPGHGQQYGNRDVDHSGNGHYEDGQYVDAHAVDGHYVDGRYVDGHYADAHVADGRFVDAAYADGHHADGHYDNGHYADGHEPVQFDEAGHPVFPQETDAGRRIRRTSKRVRRRRRTVVMFLVVAGFLAVAVFAFQLVSPMLGAQTAKDYPGPGHGSIMFTVDPGSSGRSVATQLVQQGVVESEGAFVDALTKANGTSLIQPGSFQMKLEMKASDAVAVLLSADANRVHYAAIAQNLRQPEVFALLAKATGIPQNQFDTLAKNPASFGLPAQAKTLEGYLAPGEYRFPVDMTAQQILAKLVQNTKDELTQAGVTNPDDQYRDLTIASIIEFEGNEANYGMISGAIENRLNNPSAETGGRLESDATVAYGLGIKSYNITDAQKQDASNPYNTFVRPGLPVGPIGSPKQKAIEAAAHPQANPYYFWVTVNLDTGETLYATTYADHLKNVAKYQAWCDANQGKCK